jgi:hypothetical protein
LTKTVGIHADQADDSPRRDELLCCFFTIPAHARRSRHRLCWRVEPDDIVVQFRLAGDRYVEYGSIALDSLGAPIAKRMTSGATLYRVAPP